MRIRLDDIRIKESFTRSIPDSMKIARCRRNYEKYGELDRKIILDDNNFLIDGYIAYLVAKENGIEVVDVIGGTFFTTYVYGKHYGVYKEYVWKIPVDKEMKLSVHVGDLVVVKTQYGEKTIKVTKVERRIKPPRIQKIEDVVRVGLSVGEELIHDGEKDPLMDELVNLNWGIRSQCFEDGEPNFSFSVNRVLALKLVHNTIRRICSLNQALRELNNQYNGVMEKVKGIANE